MDDELSEAERIRVEAKLAESAEMRAYLEDLRALHGLFQRVEMPISEPPPVPASLFADTRRAPAPMVNAGALRLAMSSAAAGIAVFVAIMVYDVLDSPDIPVSFSTGAAQVEAEVPTARVTTEPEAAAQSAASESADAPEAQPAASTQASADSQLSVSAGSDDGAEETSARAQRLISRPPSVEAAADLSDGDAGGSEASQAEAAADDPSRRALNAGQSGW